MTTDSSAFTASAISTTNGGQTAGKPDSGDKVTFTFSKAPEPATLISGWSGGTLTTSVVIADRASYGFGAGDDLFGVLDGSGAQANLGYVETNADFVSGGKTVTFPGSTVVLSGSTLTVTLGTPDVATNVKTDTAKNTLVWPPTASMTDLFGNPSATTTVSSASVKQF